MRTAEEWAYDVSHVTEDGSGRDPVAELFAECQREAVAATTAREAVLREALDGLLTAVHGMDLTTNLDGHTNPHALRKKYDAAHAALAQPSPAAALVLEAVDLLRRIGHNTVVDPRNEASDLIAKLDAALGGK